MNNYLNKSDKLSHYETESVWKFKPELFNELEDKM